MPRYRSYATIPRCGIGTDAPESCSIFIVGIYIPLLWNDAQWLVNCTESASDPAIRAF